VVGVEVVVVVEIVVVEVVFNESDEVCVVVNVVAAQPNVIKDENNNTIIRKCRFISTPFANQG
jgi:hypothetical protein